jgi:hypothetical protein
MRKLVKFFGDKQHIVTPGDSMSGAANEFSRMACAMNR